MRLHKAAATAFAGAMLFSVPGTVRAQTEAQPDRTILPIPPAPFRGHITETIATSTMQPNASLHAPKAAPNVLLILLDDAGYGQTGTFGGIIPTPTLDALAANGLRYTRFGVEALCSPTRSALLTGRNNHAVGMGNIINSSDGFPGDTGAIPRSAALLPEVLRENGYSTACIGKWHLIPDAETVPSATHDHWPNRQGCDFYYGFLHGETDQWTPELYEDSQPVRMEVPPGREADYTLNESLADHAREWVLKQKGLDPDKPVFLYLATGATHAPLQAPKAWIDEFRGQFDMGWDVYREQTLARQKKLGVVPQDTVLTPRPPEIPAWDSLSPDEKKIAARLMEVFAGMMAQTDYEVGRVLDAFRQTGQLDNTLVIFIAGDNGASLEGGLKGTDSLPQVLNGVPAPASEVVQRLDTIGLAGSVPHYPVGWAWAGNTPFQWGKRIGSHLGGTRDPMVLSWPGHITQTGTTRSQYTHVTDIVPTVLEAAGLPIPQSVDGTVQQPIDGVSLLYTLNAPDAPERHTVQYSEMVGNLSIYDHGWMAAQRSGLLPWETKAVFSPTPWELYDLRSDYSEADNLASSDPTKLAQMQQSFHTEAVKNNVYPIDPRMSGRPSHNPGPPAGSDHYTFYAGTGHLPNGVAPVTIGRTHTITATIEMPASGGDGVLVADGGDAAGYTLYVQDGHAKYTYNYFKRIRTTLASKSKLTPGHHVIVLQSVYDGGGPGKGATLTLTVDGVLQQRTHMQQTVPRVYSYEEAFDIGEDSASAVGPYTAPFKFTGTIDKIELLSPPPANHTAADTAREAETARRIAAVTE